MPTPVAVSAEEEAARIAVAWITSIRSPPPLRPPPLPPPLPPPRPGLPAPRAPARLRAPGAQPAPPGPPRRALYGSRRRKPLRLLVGGCVGRGPDGRRTGSARPVAERALRYSHPRRPSPRPPAAAG